MSLVSKISSLGLSLLTLLCVAITLLLWHVVDPCNLTRFPDVGGKLSNADCYDMLRAAIASTEHPDAAAELVFVFTLATRIEAAVFVAIAVASTYALTLDLADRHSLLLLLATFGTVAAAVDGSTAGVVPFGYNAMVTEKARKGTVVLLGVWCVIAPCLWIGFFGSVPGKGPKVKRE